MHGKLQPEILKRSVLSYTGACREDLLLGGGLGEDAALIKITVNEKAGLPANEKAVLVVSSDPVVGAERNAGKLLVNINANDIVCKGADPSWLIVTLIVPEAGGTVLIEKIMHEIHSECLKNGIAIAGGHTELTDRYTQPVISGTMLGITRYELSIKNINDGDFILVTGHAGLEGMSIIANDRPDLISKIFSPEEIEIIKSWSNELSILEPAKILREFSSYMHDPTEGGIYGALFEISQASGKGIEIYHDKIPVSEFTSKASEALNFDPMNLISSGMLIAVISPDKVHQAQGVLNSKGIKSQLIGKISGSKKTFLNAREELWAILARK